MFQRSKFEDDIAGLFPAAASPRSRFDEVATGASNDLERVTRIARDMVTRYGMSETLGPLTYGEREEMVSSAARSAST
ncbi:MAG: hypothetical protein IPG72_14475 [Ardenticatenales bacterium]|nr:hypothetical protein [Ardenticatenales bacterium]